MPDFSLELERGGRVCGLDEAGRGPLAGPVVAACVYVPRECYALPFVSEIRDSKMLSEGRLAYLAEAIEEHFMFGVCEVGPQEIDRINILQASMAAMARALDLLDAPVDHALVDGNRIPRGLPCSATAVIGGDDISISIAAASIIAKVHRDRIMRGLAREYPHYGWERNVGYPTAEHRAAIEVHGITPHHRRSFGPVKNFIAAEKTKIYA